MSAQVVETCKEKFGCKIAGIGRCAGATTVRAEGSYIGATDVTPLRQGNEQSINWEDLQKSLVRSVRIQLRLTLRLKK